MNKATFYELFLDYFGQQPTADQLVLFEKLTEFVFLQNRNPLFILKGYAGTGKTTILGAFVKTLREGKARVKLLAPTGRAAKVLGGKSNQLAFTIHKSIYRRTVSSDGAYRVSLMPNLHKNALFIVDEASMISAGEAFGGSNYALLNDGQIGGQNLLEDLMEYVYSGEGCKLILLGDDGQLPPVGGDFSPALSASYLQENYPKCTITEVKLSQVVRQTEDSIVLRNATALRSAEEGEFPHFKLEKSGDLIRLPGDEIQEQIENSFQRVGMEETILITRSNKRANQYNQLIRSAIFDFEEDLCSGDLLMAVKNNYFWLADDSSIGFIANGEMLVVKRVLRREELYGFSFAEVTVQFVDYPQEVERDILVLLNTLNVEGPNLPREEMKKLFYAVEQDYLDEHNKRKRYEKILKNPHFNALQVKYAYAVTCHKSQGGQWANVFLDQGYLTEDMLDAGYFRWLYTALTRATEKVFLMNFKDEFFLE